MALYDTALPQTAYARKSLYGGGNLLINKYGKLTGFGAGVSAALPVLTTVGGTVASALTGIPGLGEAGNALGKMGVNAALSGAAGGRDGYTDSKEAAQQAAAKGMGLAAIGGQIGSVVGGFTGALTGGKPKVPDSTVKSATSGVTSALPSILPDVPKPKTEASSSLFSGNVGKPTSQQMPGMLDDGTFDPLFGTRRPKQTVMFADGGPSIQPLAIRPITDDTQRRYGRFNRMFNNRIDDGVAPAYSVSPESQKAVDQGAGFVRNWLAGSGYGSYAGGLTAPTVLPENTFKQQYGFNAAGANVKQDDGTTRSFLRDGVSPDLLRTASVEETTHAAQQNMANLPVMQRSMQTLASRVKPGLTGDAASYLADPREMQARLMRMREVNNEQNPNQRFNRLGWMVRTLFKKPEAFKDLRQVMSRRDIFRSLNDTFANGGIVRPKFTNYAFGGVTGSVQHPSEYTVYGKGDKTEDLAMYDKRTGEKYGEMRIGEYILPQKKTLIAADIMEKGIPASQKKAALGSLLFGQLKAKPASALLGGNSFARGGVAKPTPTPTKPIKSVSGGIVTYQDGTQESAADLQKRLDTAIGMNALSGKTDNNLTTYRSALQSAMNTERASRGIGMGSAGAVAQTSRPLPRPYGWADPKTATSLTDAKTTPPPSGTPLVPKNPKAAGDGKPNNQSAGNNKKTPPPVVDTRKDIITPNQITNPGTNARTAAIIEKQLNPFGAQIGRLNTALAAQVAANNATQQTQVVPKNKDSAKLVTGLSDLAQLATGVALGSQKVDMPTIPARWSNYMGEVEQRKNMGLTPEERAGYSNAIANNYRQGVNSLGMLTGGGASPGTTLAGLTNLGLQRGQQTQNMLAADAARRQQNFGLYGVATGQTAAMESAIQQEGINRQAARQAIGNQLVGSTLQNIQDRAIYQKNQPLYDALMQAQIDSANESADTMRQIKKKYMGGLPG